MMPRDNRPVPVYIAVRRDKQMEANAAMIKLMIAVLNHGNTVKNTEYSFLANLFAARGYLVISPQHDLLTDPPMVTKPGENLRRALDANSTWRGQYLVRPK